MLGGEASCHAMIRRMIQRLEVDAGGGYVTVRGGMTLMADATGLKQRNRGEWIRHRWSVRRGFVRAHLLVDGDTKRIVSVAVTDEAAGDGPQLKQMLENAQEHGGLPCKVGDDAVQGNAVGTGIVRRNMSSSGIPPLAEPDGGAVLLADAAYASRKNVAECGRRGIEPLIRMKTSSTDRGKGRGDAWGLLLRRQQGGGPREAVGGLPREERLENLRYWKSTVGYGTRWIVEIVISAIKRMFGEDVMARKWPNMVREVVMRLALHNRWAAEAAAA